jgi:hypothetical protein
MLTEYKPWLGLVAAPFLFLANMQVCFMLVPWVCGNGHFWTIHASHLTTLVLIALCGVPARHLWQVTGESVPSEGPGHDSRDRFLALLSMSMTGLTALALIAHWVPNFVFEACQ